MSILDTEVVETLAEKVVQTLRDRGPGHCLQVPHIPGRTADLACESVERRLEGNDRAVVVTSDPDARKPWQARPAKVVELRNSAEDDAGRLVLFLPAGEHLAAEDSFGRSTFEVLELAGIYREIVERLRLRLRALSPEIADRADEITAAVRGDRRFGIDDHDIAAYLARLAMNPEREQLGRAIVELGLLPDSALVHEESVELPVRLARNLQYAQALTELGPPVDRVQAIAIPEDLPERDSFRAKLLGALSDGMLDRQELCRRLDSADGGADFAPLIVGSGGTVTIDELAITRLTGSFQQDSDPLTLSRSDAKVKIAYRCRPAADTVQGLKQLRLEVLQLAEQGGELIATGIEATKRTLPSKPDGTWSLTIPTQNLDSGLYRLRLRAIDENNHPLKEALSEQFRIHEHIEEVEDELGVVASVAAASVKAFLNNAAGVPARTPKLSAIASGDGDTGRKLGFTIRFDEVPGRWRLEVSSLLAKVQSYTFSSPRSLARYRISFATNELEETILPDPGIDLPDAFLEARERILNEIARQQYPLEGAGTTPLVELCDLAPLVEAIDAYVDSWASALETAESPATLRALLSVDQVSFTDGPLANGVLVGPMHPLRLAWLAHYETTIDQWLSSTSARETEGDEVSALLEVLAPANVPHVLVTEYGELRHLESLDLYWGIWAPPTAPDIGALPGLVRRRFELPRQSIGGIGVPDIVQRIRRYLAAHPYVELLELNFVQPGAAQLVLQTLLLLQAERATEDLRYVVRLFATKLARSELGRALDEFMAEPDATKAARRNEADAFLSSTDDPLAPKLTYSKHGVDELLASPERFPAHLTFFLDWFDLDVVPVPPVDDRRSFYANGLIVDPVVIYREGSEDLNPQWDEHVAPGGAGRGSFVEAFAASERGTARLLGIESSGTVPAVRLELDRVRRSILDAVHRYSDWVVVIDPVFTEDFLDSPPEHGEAPRYLIDSMDTGALETNRRIMISSRSRIELRNLLFPILHKYGLEIADDRVDVLLDGLRALSAGLPLKLLNNPTQALEALTLSLATLHLAQRGVLRHALVVPLDRHQDLFRETGGSDAESIDLRRTDLALIRLDPEQRRIWVSLVEVKARGRLPQATPPDLVEHVAAQLENSRDVLRKRLFSADVRQRQGSLAGALMIRRLTRLLSRYTDRAVRYGFLEPSAAQALRPFLATLDHRFTISFEKHALLFDLEGESQERERLGNLFVTRIGRDDILGLLDSTQTPVGTQVPEGDGEQLETVFVSDLGGAQVEEVPDAIAGTADHIPETGPVETGDQDGKELEDHEEHEGDAVEIELSGPKPEDVLILGSDPSEQFGIIGRLHASGRNIAFDVHGTNVVAVFGVQGAGKSYTVGNLVEAAVLKSPELNRLPHPLAAVVFHYSSNETYLPEFAAMAEANDDPGALEMLAGEYGVDPRGVEDVQILVPEPLVAERRREFPGLQVHPLVLATSELTTQDWKLLMGVEGGDQMYVKAMGNIFRSLRNKITLGGIRDALDDSSLSKQQKGNATTRLDFVEAFAADTGGASDYVRPGRLLIVDVRDPYMDKTDVLALFMVLLRLFSQARDTDGRKFNKLIVFDEAHKYMENPTLTGAIVETVREMRHLGTSVVIASQNPPSVPREIIELCSVLVTHKFTSPQWLEHIRKVNEAFARDLAPPQLAALSPGEAYVWSRDGAEDLRRPQRVRMRPRLTRHGGGTRRAGDE